VDYALLGLLMMTFVGSHVLYSYRLGVRRTTAVALRPVATEIPEA
jgi:hypothetical protein